MSHRVGARHNIEFKGVLSDIVIDTKFITDICQLLPSTLMERINIAAERGAQHGILRGASKVVEHAVKKMGYSETAANYFRQTTYYGSCFTLALWNVYTQPEGVTGVSTWYAFYQAAMDVGLLFTTNKIVETTCHAAQQISYRAERSGWNNTGRFFKAISQYGGYGIYARNAYSQGILETATNLAAGNMAEKALETAGTFCIDFFSVQL